MTQRITKPETFFRPGSAGGVFPVDCLEMHAGVQELGVLVCGVPGQGLRLQQVQFLPRYCILFETNGPKVSK